MNLSLLRKKKRETRGFRLKVNYAPSRPKKLPPKPFRDNYEIHVSGIAKDDAVNKLSFSLGDDGALECVGYLGCRIKDYQQIKCLGRWLLRAARQMNRRQNPSPDKPKKRKGPRVRRFSF
jgi:hypothetical protein